MFGVIGLKEELRNKARVCCNIREDVVSDSDFDKGCSAVSKGVDEICNCSVICNAGERGVCGRKDSELSGAGSRVKSFNKAK